MAQQGRDASTRPRYNFKQYGQSSRKQGRLGDHVIKPQSGCEVWTPTWNHTTTVFRPFPVPSREDPEVLCGFRCSDQPNDFDDWIRGYPAVRSWGDPGLTFLLYDPTDHNYDPETNPAWVLWRFIDGRSSAGQASPEMQRLTKGGEGRSAMIKRPGDIFIMQGALLEHKSKPNSPPRGGAEDDDLLILECTSTVIQALSPQLNELSPPDTYDPVSLEPGQGALFRIYQLGGAADPDISEGGSGFGGQRMGGQQRDFIRGYGAKVIREWNGVSGDLSGVADMVQEKVKPWDDIVNIMTHEEQAKLLSRHFPPQVIWDAFADYRQSGWIPENVIREMTAPTTVPVQTDVSSQQPPMSTVPADSVPGTVTDAGGWGVTREAGPQPTEADPAARPQGDTQTTEVTDQTVPDGIPMDDIAAAAGQGTAEAGQDGALDDAIADARRAVNE